MSVKESNPLFFRRLNELLDANIERDLHNVMVRVVESEAKTQVYGQGSIDAAIANRNVPRALRTAHNSHDDTDNYHPYGHLNRITGNLQRSITTETERNGDVVISSVGTNANYAPIHELGGFTGSAYIPARPFLVPAMEIRKDEVRDYMHARVRKMIELASR